MSEKGNVYDKIEKLFVELGFEEMFFIRKWLDEPEKSYVKKNLYCRLDYFDSCFVIEYAHDLYEAENNLYGDGDRFPFRIGEAAILSGIKKELLEALSEDDSHTVPLFAELKVAV